ncbi:MAG TPA: SPOR domain-containing protein [Blastocatellia bacterium]|nr:SPOR domain-containing protein [Blastocatellia bacterium]HNG31911.1 SPOR domain-containing protein [Blastocatellia bacterium]
MGNSQPLNNPAANPVPTQNRDVYATRIGDDFDDVLDIPRQAPQSFPPVNEPAAAFEDVFAMPNYDSPTNFEFPPQEKKPTAPIEGFPTGSGRQRSTQDYAAAPEPELMGWPVLPENSEEDQEPVGTYTTNRGAMLARVGLVVVVFGLLGSLAYYVLFNKIGNRQESFPEKPTAPANSGVAAPAQNLPPVTDSNPGSKPPETKVQPNNPSAQNTTQNATTNTSQSSKPTETSRPVPVPPIEGSQGRSQSPRPVTQAGLPPTPQGGNLTIQVGSFSDQAQASERVSRLESLGAKARVVKADVSGKTWYRVRVGGFKSREEAASYANKLKAQGAVQDFIITPDK